MSSWMKIGDVAKLTGIPARRIKVYTGNAAGRMRYFEPEGKMECGENRNKDGDHYTKAWLFSDSDVRKIRFVHMLEMLDFLPEKIRDIMSQPDYTSAVDFDELLEQIDDKIALYKSYKQFVSNLRVMGTDYLNDFMAVKVSELSSLMLLSQQRYGARIEATRAAHLNNEEQETMRQELNALFERSSKVIGSSLDSPEVQQLISAMTSFTRTYIDSATPLRQFMEFVYVNLTPQAVSTIDSRFGDGTAEFIASVASGAFLKELEIMIEEFRPLIGRDPTDADVKTLMKNYMENRYSLFTGEIDSALCLPDFLTGDALLETDDTTDPGDIELYTFFNQALQSNYITPLLDAVYDLAALNGAKSKVSERHDKAAILFGQLYQLFGDNPYESVKWYTLAFTEFDSIKTPIDKQAGDGAAAFIGLSLKEYIDDCVKDFKERQRKEEDKK